MLRSSRLRCPCFRKRQEEEVRTPLDAVLRQDVRDVKLRGAARNTPLRGDLLVREIVEEVVQDLLLSRRQRQRASNRPPRRAGCPPLVDEAGEERPRNPESTGVNLPEDTRQALRSFRVSDEPF